MPTGRIRAAAEALADAELDHEGMHRIRHIDRLRATVAVLAADRADREALMVRVHLVRARFDIADALSETAACRFGCYDEALEAARGILEALCADMDGDERARLLTQVGQVERGEGTLT